MKILNLELTRFKRLEVPRIRRLKLALDNKFQVIIGSNGSGKTSVLKELLPNAPTKTLFPKDSYKRLELEHNNSIFELVYSPSHGHLFVKDGTNLNTSGKRTIQLELLEKHFNLNTEHTQILQGSLPVVSMRPSQRQAMFIKLNPIDIQLFVEEKSRLHKQVTAYNNQLSLLYKRQEAITTKLIPEDEYEAVCKSVDKLNEEEKTILVYLTTISTKLQGFTNTSISHKVDELISTSRKALQTLSTFPDMANGHLQERLFSNREKLKDLRNHQKVLSKDIVEAVSSIEKHTANLNEMKHKTTFGDEIVALKKKLKKLTFPDKPISYFIPEDMLASKSLADAMLKINTLLAEFNSITTGEIIGRNELQELRNKRDTIATSMRDTNNTLQSIESRIETLVKQIINYKIGTGCNTDNCELYITYYKHKTAREEELAILNKQESKEKKALTEQQTDLDELNETYKTYVYIWKLIDGILSIAETHPVLFNVIDRDNIHDQLNQSISRFRNDLNTYLDCSNNYHKHAAIFKQVAELELRDKTTGEANKTSLALIQEALDTAIAYRTKLIAEQDSIDSICSELTKSISIAEDCNLARELLRANVVKAEEMVEAKTNEGKSIYLNKLYKGLTYILDKIRTELSSGKDFIQEQLVLRNSLDNEILANIKLIKTKKDDVVILESSLKELSHLYTRTFLNNLIASANRFIDEIINYPVVIQPIKNDDINFIFPITINDKINVPDISECSDAQKVVIELAINLALIVELKLTDYPLLLDEKDRALDPILRENLYSLLLKLADQGIVSQLFVINHHTDFINSQFSNTIVLDATNLKLTDSVTTEHSNTLIEYY